MSAQPPTAPYWRLEAAARRVGLAPRRVRRYVRAGLVRPARVEGRVVLFGEAELARLRKIRRLVDELGVNIAGVEIILRLVDELAVLRAPTAGSPGERSLLSGRD
jgi:MerR family transcriptional regulator/heat shock protein HspR